MRKEDGLGVRSQPREEALRAAEGDERLPETAVRILVDPEVPVVRQLHERSETLHSGRARPDEPAVVDLRRAIIGVHDGPGAVAVARGRGVVMVEEKRSVVGNILFVQFFYCLLVLAEKIDDDELLPGLDTFEDERIHRAVPGQRDLQRPRRLPAMPGDGGGGDAVEVGVADDVKQRVIHLVFSFFDGTGCRPARVLKK